MPSVSTVKTASTMIRTPTVVKAAEKRKPRRRPPRRRSGPVDPEKQLRTLIDKVDAATLDRTLG